jgi:ABC-type Fe3+-hydroxamate transport system substrate-binding protein
VIDDLGRPVQLRGVPARVVSLVPSITELLFTLGAGGTVVGSTRFCVEPPAARRVFRVGGPKDPDVAAITALQPELVIANAEENRREDVEVLTAAGIPVYVTFPRSVAAGINLARQVGALVGCGRAGALLAARLEAARTAVVAAAAARRRPRVFCPIWKRPWMTIARDTFAHDMLATAGGENVCAHLAGRYPAVDADSLAPLRPEVVLLPSEPYPFRPRDLADLEGLLSAAQGPRPVVRFIDGRALTWYGHRIDWGLKLVQATLASCTLPVTG